MTACDYDLPDHFDDKTVVDAFKSSFLSDSNLWPFNISEERSLYVELGNKKAYPLVCGLLLKLRTAMFRVAKRSRMREVSGEDTYEERLYRLMKCFLSSDFDSSFLIEWTPKTLFLAGTELARKSVFLSAKLQKELNDQPLRPLNTATNRLEFEAEFLRQVAEYHKNIQRPSGTFSIDMDKDETDTRPAEGSSESSANGTCSVDMLELASLQIDEHSTDDVSDIRGEVNRTVSRTVSGTIDRTASRNHHGKDSEVLRNLDIENTSIRKSVSTPSKMTPSLTETLAASERERCHLCGGNRQIYCGSCGGVRVGRGGSLLPPRVSLPFDLLLVVHWAEDMHKCTGVHASVLATEGSVEYATWNKIVPQKEVVEVVRRTWERKEKKEYNAARDMMYRRKKIDVVEVQAEGEDKGGDETQASCSSSGAHVINSGSSQGTSSAVEDAEDNVGVETTHSHSHLNSECTSTSAPSSSSIPTPIPIPPPIVPHINNDVSGGINMDSLEEIDRKWGPMAASLDPCRDVILFPSDQAEHADTFPWGCRNINRNHAQAISSEGVGRSNTNSHSDIDSHDTALHCASSSSSSSSSAKDSLGGMGVEESTVDGDVDLKESKRGKSEKWRLVVLESSWQHGKTMLRQLTTYRELKGLPPLRSVIVTGVTGEYWRFHEEGNAAVSTIEAIKHTASAAGMCGTSCEVLLTLFRLQKRRVLQRVKEGGRAPKAVLVRGEGLGSWDALTMTHTRTQHADASDAVQGEDAV